MTLSKRNKAKLDGKKSKQDSIKLCKVCMEYPVIGCAPGNNFGIKNHVYHICWDDVEKQMSKTAWNKQNA